MSSEAAKRATAKYQRDKMESISIRVRKDERLGDRIRQAAKIKNTQAAKNIKNAILSALESDGITIDKLPTD